MKKLAVLSLFVASAMSLLTSCSTAQSADQSLKDDNQRKEITTAMVHNPAYASEMMQCMMSNDSCKQMMGQTMMSDPSMKSMMMDNMMDMCMSDTSMCKMMMGKTMDMCEGDQSKCIMMMGTMQSHPNVMKSMNGMCGMDMNMNKDQPMKNPKK